MSEWTFLRLDLSFVALYHGVFRVHVYHVSDHVAQLHSIPDLCIGPRNNNSRHVFFTFRLGSEFRAQVKS